MPWVVEDQGAVYNSGFLFESAPRMLSRLRHYYRLSNIAGASGIASAALAKITGAERTIEVSHPLLRFPFIVRVPSSDLSVAEQILVSEEYGFAVRFAPSTIVDAGANIGLAAVYFANRFPLARIIAIEPESSNFALLLKNIRPYPNIVAVQAALWNENVSIDVVDPKFGKWGFMTASKADGIANGSTVTNSVNALTVDRVMALHAIERIDILKIDVEGAEREVFMDPSRWIDKVDNLIVELHDRMKEGCVASFNNGARGFDVEWSRGENIYRSKIDTCLLPPETAGA